MMKTTREGITVGEIVADDFRAATILREAGIDFCCGGNKSFSEACRENNVNKSEVEVKLKELEKTSSNSSHNYKDWDPLFLSEYIKNTHHKYLIKTLPELLFYTQKIADVHGNHHPELPKVAELFKDLNEELLQHMKKEEELLFPAIQEVSANNSDESKTTIISEISRLQSEHEFAGGAMAKINDLTSNYEIPKDGCRTYQVTLDMLKQFEEDLHLHVHLENNILFKKALALAKK